MSKTGRLGAFTLVCAVWGSTWIASSEIEGHCPPFRLAAIRYGIAGALLLLISFIKKVPPPNARELAGMLGLGATMIALPFVLFFYAGNGVPAGAIAVLFSISPIALALASSADHGSPISRMAFYATLGGFAGVVLAMAGSFSLSLARLGPTMAAGSAILSVTASMGFARTHLRTVSPLLSAGTQLCAASLLLLAVSVVAEQGRPTDWTQDSLIALAALSLLGSALALPLFYRLLQVGESYQAAAVEWIQPLVAVFEGALLLHRRLPSTFFAGVLAVLGCAGILLWDDREHPLSLSFRATGDTKRY
ncbi:MAG TPA: DMT family transporter [Acidisarcina sp.]